MGDRILYAKYTGQEIKIDQEEYLIIKESDLLGKITTSSNGAKGSKAKAKAKR